MGRLPEGDLRTLSTLDASNGVDVVTVLSRTEALPRGRCTLALPAMTRLFKRERLDRPACRRQPVESPSRFASNAAPPDAPSPDRSLGVTPVVRVSLECRRVDPSTLGRVSGGHSGAQIAVACSTVVTSSSRGGRSRYSGRLLLGEGGAGYESMGGPAHRGP